MAKHDGSGKAYRFSTVNMFKNIRLEDGMIEISGDSLKELQDALLTVMDDIDSICRKHGINYFLSGGSMLGAVRHKGFIPWDDDLDIFMTRKDFESFVSVFDRELKDAYWLHTPRRTKNYGISISRIRKKGTVFRCREDSGTSECGIYADIFVLENTYDNHILRNLHGLLCMTAGFALSCRMFFSRRKLYMSMAKHDRRMKRIFRIKTALGFLASFLSLDTWTVITDRIYSMCANEDSVYVVCPSGRKHFTGEMYHRDPFCKVTECEFEGRIYYISQWYDGYLKNMYGEYMLIPDEDDREHHVVYELKL